MAYGFMSHRFWSRLLYFVRPAGGDDDHAARCSCYTSGVSKRTTGWWLEQCLQDYYEVLGVSKGASEGEIKRAYKKLALKLEPNHSLVAPSLLGGTRTRTRSSPSWRSESSSSGSQRDARSSFTRL